MLQRAVERLAHTRLHALGQQIGGHPDGHAAQVVTLGHGDRLRQLHRGRVAVIPAGDHLQRQRRVAHRQRERADLVERAAEGDQAMARDGAVCGLHPDHPAERRRLPDRAAGVGAQRERGQPGGHGRRRAAARPARHHARVPRVVRGAEGGVLRGRAHRELVHVGLAERDQPGCAGAGDHAGVVQRPVPLQDPGAGRGLLAPHAEDVLERDRDALQTAATLTVEPRGLARERRRHGCAGSS